MNLIEISDFEEYHQSIGRSDAIDSTIQQKVSEIIHDIMGDGDASLFKYTNEFDKVQLQTTRVPVDEIDKAGQSMDDSVRTILSKAIENIRRFHKFQISESWSKEYEDGSVLGEVVNPLDRVGIYVPGGLGFYPSTMIMNAVPAQIARVPSVVIASPPNTDGQPHPLVLGICAMLEIEEVYSMGGAQAIAALAYGTETVRPVDKITGPGNIFVQEAKRQVYGQVGIDSIAGPSEILILHDDDSVPVDYIVRDMLTQAEHDEDAAAILITTSRETGEKVQRQINKLVPDLPRSEIIMASLKNNGRVVIVDTLDQGIDLVNEIAPEHLEILITDETNISKIRNAGALFIGQWSTETVGDYFAGPNHTIPTSRAARFASPLSVREFVKHSSYIKYSKQRLEAEGETIAKFAELEGFYAHAAAVRERIK